VSRGISSVSDLDLERVLIACSQSFIVMELAFTLLTFAPAFEGTGAAVWFHTGLLLCSLCLYFEKPHPLYLLIILGCRITFTAMPALASCAPDDPTLQQLSSSYAKFAAWAAEINVRARSMLARQPLYQCLQMQIGPAALTDTRQHSVSGRSGASDQKG